MSDIKERFIIIGSILLIILSISVPELQKILRTPSKSKIEKNIEKIILKSNDWRLYQGYAERNLSGYENVKNKEIYKKAILLNPSEAQLYSNLSLLYIMDVRFSRKEENLVLKLEKPLEDKTNFKEEDIREAMEYLHLAAKIEPENAYYDYLFAYLYFAEKKDEEGLKVLQRARRKNYCDMHRKDALLSTIKFLKKAGFPELEAKLDAFPSLLLPQLAKLRYVARIAIALAYQYQENQQHERAIEIYEGVFDMGSKIKNSAWTIIDMLVGIAIQEMIVSPFLPEDLQKEKLDVSEKNKIAQKKFIEYLIENSNLRFAEKFKNEISSGEILRKKFRSYVGKEANYILMHMFSVFIISKLFSFSFSQFLVFSIISILCYTLFSEYAKPLTLRYGRISAFIIVFSILYIVVTMIISLVNSNYFTFFIFLPFILTAVFVSFYTVIRLKKAKLIIKSSFLPFFLFILKISGIRVLMFFLIFSFLIIPPVLIERKLLLNFIDKMIESEVAICLNKD